MVTTGLETFLKTAHKKYKKLSLGVVCNQATVDQKKRHISEAVLEKKLGLKIKSFFGPQHGIRGEKQDNMVESADFVDPVTNLPVVSLYGTHRDPQQDQVKDLDAFLIDLPDIGTRIYTFMYTMANCMRAAQKHGKKVIVLDRPNPINGVTTEGNVLETGFTSFVGQFPLCTRHAMTLGELALMFNVEFKIGCDLDIIKCKGWKRSQYYDEWKSDWICPSPNIPNLTSALTFPGCVHFEGTNISEGRGTTRPFEYIGAPYIQPDKLAREMNRGKLPGVFFRPIYFQPTYQKWRDQVCGGVQIHVTSRKQFNAFKSGIRLLAKIAQLFEKDFEWKPPPYEYEFERMPIDLIAGTSRLRECIDSHKKIGEFESEANKQLEGFRKVRRNYLIY
jgi:uncharacterized protein YbbC (DUF1343 family)